MPQLIALVIYSRMSIGSQVEIIPEDIKRDVSFIICLTMVARCDI